MSLRLVHLTSLPQLNVAVPRTRGHHAWLQRVPLGANGHLVVRLPLAAKIRHFIERTHKRGGGGVTYIKMAACAR